MIKKMMMYLAAMVAAFTFAVPAAFAAPSNTNESFSFRETVQPPSVCSCKWKGCTFGCKPKALADDLKALMAQEVAVASEQQPDGRRKPTRCSGPTCILKGSAADPMVTSFVDSFMPADSLDPDGRRKPTRCISNPKCTRASLEGSTSS